VTAGGFVEMSPHGWLIRRGTTAITNFFALKKQAVGHDENLLRVEDHESIVAFFLQKKHKTCGYESQTCTTVEMAGVALHVAFSDITYLLLLVIIPTPYLRFLLV